MSRLSSDLRDIAESMEGWNHQQLVLEAADTLDRQARVMRELLEDRDREIARLRGELTAMTERWHDANRARVEGSTERFHRDYEMEDQ